MAQVHPNPFLQAREAYPRDLTAMFREPAAVEAPKPEQLGYVMVKSAPSLRAEECEVEGSLAIEVTILWGQSVIHVAHLSPPRSFYVGEDSRPGAETDFLIPSEKLGTGRAPLVLCESGTLRVVVPSGATGLSVAGGQKRTLSQAIEGAEAVAELTGARGLSLDKGDRIEINHGGFTYRVAAVAAGKRIERGLLSDMDSSAPAYFGLSLFAHAAMLGAMAFFTPQMGLTDDEASGKDRMYMVQQYLDASALRELEAAKEEASKTPDDSPAGDTAGGEASKGDMGAMGKQDAPHANKRFAYTGPKDNPDPTLPRDRALAEASTFGLIGMLDNMNGDPNAVTAPWGRDEALGRDPMSAIGNMWGDDLGESGGSGGLGLSGVGEGGGGIGIGIGLNQIGTCGKDVCPGLNDGFGKFWGRPGQPQHVAKVPRVRPGGDTTVSGHLPREVIQRVVRQNYGRFRMCYESGLRSNPNLEGRVAARFVIDREGRVSMVSNGGSDLPDSGVVSCVVSAYYGLSFPAPETGIVTVVYPIQFSPG